MGEELLKGFGQGLDVVAAYQAKDPARTSGADTRDAAKAMKAAGAGLILFCGGDGTARDINAIVGQDIPVLGIPAGVKMHSGVFGTTPAAVSDILRSYLKGEADIAEAEVMDIDEEAYRQGRLQVKLHGLAKVPKVGSLVQASKAVYHQPASEVQTLEIADYFKEIVERRTDTCFFLGAGSTLTAIKTALGLRPTVLGIDAYLDGRQIGEDLNEAGGAKAYAACVSPIGAQGFVLGRGSQQFSPEIIRRIGVQNFHIVATSDKLMSLEALRIDTGDAALDCEFAGYKRVINGFRTQRITKLIS
jgi:predicted polyphosphate/ATP-dependent NAD kinase